VIRLSLGAPAVKLGTASIYCPFADIQTLHQSFGTLEFKVKDAPNPTDWEAQFIKTKFDLVCDWDLEFFKNLDFKKPKFLTFAVQNKSDEELLRKDFTIENEPQYVNLENGKYSVNLETTDKPNKIVMFLFDEDKQWSPRYEKQL